MLRYFEAEYVNSMHVIVGNDPKFKKINDRIFKKSEELCQLVGGVNPSVWDLFEEVMDKYHKIELILSKAMHLKGTEDREKMIKS